MGGVGVNSGGEMETTVFEHHLKKEEKTIDTKEIQRIVKVYYENYMPTN